MKILLRSRRDITGSENVEVIVGVGGYKYRSEVVRMSQKWSCLSAILAQKPALHAEALTYKKVLEIILLPYQHIFSLKMSIISNQENFQKNLSIHNINTRKKNHIHRSNAYFKEKVYFELASLFSNVHHSAWKALRMKRNNLKVSLRRHLSVPILLCRWNCCVYRSLKTMFHKKFIYIYIYKIGTFLYIIFICDLCLCVFVTHLRINWMKVRGASRK